MTYGFRFQTGPSSSDVVEITSTDLHTGILVDAFKFAYASGTSETRTYSSFPGNTLFVLMTPTYSASGFYDTSQSFTVNNSTKTVTITNKTGAGTWETGDVFVTVIGF